jgi:hypothetical protein
MNLKQERQTPMHLLQNLKRKSIVRNTMTLLAAIALGTALATDALAAGGGGGGGGHFGGGLGGGHIAGGFVGGRMGGDHPGGRGGAFLGNGGGGDFRNNRMGGEFHERDHRFRERFGGGGGGGGYAYAPGYDDYGYDGLSDYAGDSGCFQYRDVYTTAGWQWRQVWVCN